MVGGFLPGVKQIANVAALPGIVGRSVGLPDIHSGYGFAIGNMAAFDCDDPKAVVSPGGVGFDINCGVRLLRTNLHEKDVQPVKEQLTQSLFDHIPVGVGSKVRFQLVRYDILFSHEKIYFLKKSSRYSFVDSSVTSLTGNNTNECT